MKESEVMFAVVELIERIDGDNYRPFKKTCSLKDLLMYLRTRIVYTVFDLEATRRELKGRS